MEFLNVDFHLGWASWKTGMDESAADRLQVYARNSMRYRAYRLSKPTASHLNPESKIQSGAPECIRWGLVSLPLVLNLTCHRSTPDVARDSRPMAFGRRVSRSETVESQRLLKNASVRWSFHRNLCHRLLWAPRS